jgi:hypothetical protein
VSQRWRVNSNRRERDRIVDDDDLLMVRPAGRMRIVEARDERADAVSTPPETRFDGRFPIIT